MGAKSDVNVIVIVWDGPVCLIRFAHRLRRSSANGEVKEEKLQSQRV